MSVLRDSSTLKSSRRGWKKDWQKSQCKSLNAIRSSGTHTSICLHAGCTREKIQIRGNDDPWRVWFYVPRAKTRPGERSTFFLFSSGGRVTVLSFFDTRLRQTGGRRATTRVNRTKKKEEKSKKRRAMARKGSEEESWKEREREKNRLEVRPFDWLFERFLLGRLRCRAGIDYRLLNLYASKGCSGGVVQSRHQGMLLVKRFTLAHRPATYTDKISSPLSDSSGRNWSLN